MHVENGDYRLIPVEWLINILKNTVDQFEHIRILPRIIMDSSVRFLIKKH